MPAGRHISTGFAAPTGNRGAPATAPNTNTIPWQQGAWGFVLNAVLQRQFPTTLALGIYPGDVPRDRSGGHFKPLGDFRLGYPFLKHPVQPGQRRLVQLVRPPTQLAPGPD